jgi:soluble lytic murein transglycosylase-like protein
VFRALKKLWTALLPAQLLIIAACVGLSAGPLCIATLSLARGNVGAWNTPVPPAAAAAAPTVNPNAIGSVFTPTVQYWSDRIVAWSQRYDIDPNILATVMQVESCGDPVVGSGAGAQGLFQVMPFHFAVGEDPHDPDTNARRAIEYLKGALDRADGHIGLALAGYNGGWGVINQGWAGWYQETKSYYLWVSQIYIDSTSGKSSADSAALQSWLRAGGIALCTKAQTDITAMIATATPAGKS